MRPSPSRPLLRQAVAIPAAALLASALLLAASGTTALAADGLQVVAATHYDVQPERARVHVTLDAIATALTPDSSTGRTYFTGLSFGLPQGATHVIASSGGKPLRVKLENQGVSVTFGSRVFYQEHYRYRVSFDLVDGGGEARRDVRVSHSLVAFPVWAFGSARTPGSSVRISIPAGFAPSAEGVELSASQDAQGAWTLSSAAIPDPLAFFSYISADRPGAYNTSPLTVRVGGASARVQVSSWDDDPAWGERMSELLIRGLPALHDLIGLDYAVAGPLKVQEAATSRLGEYAGIYNDVTRSITIRYDADPLVGLHEAAHIWFNEDLFRDRWINEAWAEFYAVRAAQQIDEPGTSFSLTPQLLQHQIPLNDWGAVGVEDLDVESFAYAATYHLAGLIFARTDAAGLRQVWQAAHDRELAYQPAHAGNAPEKGAAVTQASWQMLLDLLEERTAADYDDLWRAWVVNDQQALLLARRDRARTFYAAVLRDAREWELPRAVRFDMSSWQFDEATELLTDARSVLSKRERIAQEAAALDLAPPPTLRSDFEGATDMTGAIAEANAELEALTSVATATQTLDTPPSTLTWIGLLGDEPQADLVAARSSFEAGDLTKARAQATNVTTTLAAAVDVGRVRVAIGGGGLLALDAMAMTALLARRRRQRSRTVAGQIPPAG